MGGGASQTPPLLFSPHLNHWGGGDESALESAVADLLRGLPIITSAGEDGQRTTDHLPTRPPTFAKGGAGGGVHPSPAFQRHVGKCLHHSLRAHGPPQPVKTSRFQRNSRDKLERGGWGEKSCQSHINHSWFIV